MAARPRGATACAVCGTNIFVRRQGFRVSHLQRRSCALLERQGFPGHLRNCQCRSSLPQVQSEALPFPLRVLRSEAVPSEGSHKISSQIRVNSRTSPQRRRVSRLLEPARRFSFRPGGVPRSATKTTPREYVSKIAYRGGVILFKLYSLGGKLAGNKGNPL